MDKIAELLNTDNEFTQAYAALEKQASAQGVDLESLGHEKVAELVAETIMNSAADQGLVPTPDEAYADSGHNKYAGMVPTPDEAYAEDEVDQLMKVAYLQGQAMWAGFQDAAVEEGADEGEYLSKTAAAALEQMDEYDLEKLAAMHAEDILLLTGNVHNEEMIKTASARPMVVEWLMENDLIKHAALNDFLGQRATEILDANDWDTDVLEEQYAYACEQANAAG